MSLLRGIFNSGLVNSLFRSSQQLLAPSRGFQSLVASMLGRARPTPSASIATGDFNLIVTREMNRNARRPKKANHGKRPVSHARRRAKLGVLKSRAYRKKIFGFW